MDLSRYQIEQDCPSCGKVAMTVDAFEGASYTQGGRVTMRFEDYFDKLKRLEGALR